jgi:hypothetical protein
MSHDKGATAESLFRIQMLWVLSGLATKLLTGSIGGFTVLEHTVKILVNYWYNGFILMPKK